MSAALARCLLTGLAMVSLANPAWADVREQLIYRDYPVRLNPDDTLRTALNRATPVINDTGRYHGYAEWEVSWRYQSRRRSNGQCRLDQIEVTLIGRIQLPRLENGDRRQRQRFDIYLAALKHHELGHYGFGQRAAQDVEAALQALPSADCQLLEAAVNEITSRVIRNYQQQELRYDRDTRHGQTQGVVLGAE